MGLSWVWAQTFHLTRAPEMPTGCLIGLDNNPKVGGVKGIIMGVSNTVPAEKSLSLNLGLFGFD